MSVDGKNPSLRSLVRVASFTEEDVQSPSPFFRLVAVEPDAAATCFLFFLAAAPTTVPSSFFLLGAMEDVGGACGGNELGRRKQW